MSWTNGPVLFEKFEMYLQGTGLNQWTALANNVEVRTVNSFWQTVSQLKRSHFPADACRKHKTFLQQVKKPRHMSPQEHYNKFQFHEIVLSLNYLVPQKTMLDSHKRNALTS